MIKTDANKSPYFIPIAEKAKHIAMLYKERQKNRRKL